MRIDKLQAEVIRIIFSINRPNYHYQWVSDADGKWSITAQQRVHPKITDPNVRVFFPLGKNTLQVLQGLQVALPIFGIALKDVDLSLHINDRKFNVKTEWRELSELLLGVAYNAEILITLQVSDNVFRSHIQPFMPSPHKDRLSNPQKLTLEETWEQVAERLRPTAAPVESAPSTYSLAYCARLGIKNILLGDWKRVDANTTMDHVTNSVMDRSSKVLRSVYVFPDDINLADIQCAITVLVRVLNDFNLADYFKKYGEFTLNNGREMLNLFAVTHAELYRVLGQTSQSTKAKVTLSLPEKYYLKLIAPLSSLELPAEDAANFLADLVAMNKEFVAKRLFAGFGFTAIQATWYDSDEEEDRQHDDHQAVVIDLRTTNDCKRFESWTFDQIEHDRQEAEKKAAELASLEQQAKTRASAMAVIKREQAARLASQPLKSTSSSVDQKAVDGIVKALNAKNQTALTLLKASEKNESKLDLLRQAWADGAIKPEAKAWLAEKSQDFYEKLTIARQVLTMQ